MEPNTSPVPPAAPAVAGLVHPDVVRERLDRFAANRKILELAERAGVRVTSLYHLCKRRTASIPLELAHAIWPVMDAMEAADRHLERLAPARRRSADPPPQGRNPPSLT